MRYSKKISYRNNKKTFKNKKGSGINEIINKLLGNIDEIDEILNKIDIDRTPERNVKLDEKLRGYDIDRLEKKLHEYTFQHDEEQDKKKKNNIRKLINKLKNYITYRQLNENLKDKTIQELKEKLEKIENDIKNIIEENKETKEEKEKLIQDYEELKKKLEDYVESRIKQKTRLNNGNLLQELNGKSNKLSINEEDRREEEEEHEEEDVRQEMEKEEEEHEEEDVIQEMQEEEEEQIKLQKYPLRSSRISRRNILEEKNKDEGEDEGKDEGEDEGEENLTEPIKYNTITERYQQEGCQTKSNKSRLGGSNIVNKKNSIIKKGGRSSLKLNLPQGPNMDCGSPFHPRWGSVNSMSKLNSLPNMNGYTFHQEGNLGFIKGGKKWSKHVGKTLKKNKNMKLSRVLSLAKKTYKK